MKYATVSAANAPITAAAFVPHRIPGVGSTLALGGLATGTALNTSATHVDPTAPEEVVNLLLEVIVLISESVETL